MGEMMSRPDRAYRESHAVSWWSAYEDIQYILIECCEAQHAGMERFECDMVRVRIAQLHEPLSEPIVLDRHDREFNRGYGDAFVNTRVHMSRPRPCSHIGCDNNARTGSKNCGKC